MSQLEHNESKTLSELNEYRKSRNLQPLKLNNLMSMYAEQHAEQMAKYQIPFSHEGYNLRIDKIKKELKLDYNPSCRENVAMSSPDCSAVELWKTSPGHNGAMLTPYFNNVGLGYYRNEKGECYWCAIFMNLK